MPPARPASKSTASAGKKPTSTPKKPTKKTLHKGTTPSTSAPLTATPVKTATVQSARSKSAPTKSDKKKEKPEKIKVVRDSFTIPKMEYHQISELKKRALGLGQAAKKSELIRAGLLLLMKQNDASLLKALAAVPTLKTGRPGKA